MSIAHVRPASAVRPAGRRRERGETLIEMLATVLLMGIGFSAILGGLFTVSSTATTNQRRTMVSNSLQTWAEFLEQPVGVIPSVTSPGYSPYTYVDCAILGAGGQYVVPSGLVPSGWTATMKVRYLTGFSGSGATKTANYQPDRNTCFTQPGGDKGIQEITLTIDTGGTNHRVVDTLVIIKRNAKCPSPAGYSNADLGPC